MKLLFVALLAASPAVAQNFGVTDDSTGLLPDMSTPAEEVPQVEIIDGQIVVEELSITEGDGETITRPREAPIVRVSSAPGAILRGLDKVSGRVTDLELSSGEAARLGRLTVELGECRYPAENPSGDAYAFVKVTAEELQEPAFEGWMIASSPALSALDHPRYDVWVMRCRTS